MSAEIEQLAKEAESRGKKACSCDPEKHEVCDLCNRTAQKVVEDMTAYLIDFVDKRFPDGVPDDFRQMMSECVLDAFHDGCRHFELQQKEESRIILQ